MIIKSVERENSYEKSGVEHQGEVHRCRPGFNLFSFKDNKLNLTTCSSGDDLVKGIKELINSDPDYLIVIYDNLPNINFNNIKADLPVLNQSSQLNLQEIKKFTVNCTYYFLFDNRSKKLISEKIGRYLVGDTFDFNPADGILTLKRSRYIVCYKRIFRYFIEYLDSFKTRLDLIYLLMDDINEYDYPGDDFYIICGSVLRSNNKLNKICMNTEQLTRTGVAGMIINFIGTSLDVIDYSYEHILMYSRNFKIMNEKIYLPYQYHEGEISQLKTYYDESPKLYDVAFCGNMSPYRQKILNGLIEKGLKVHNVIAWGDLRDKQIMQCKILVNIHYEPSYNVYESIRCDRLAFAGMPIISETSIYSDELDVNKHNVVRFHPYDQLIEATVNFIKNESGLVYPSEENIQTVRKLRDESLELVKNYFRQ